MNPQVSAESTAQKPSVDPQSNPETLIAPVVPTTGELRPLGLRQVKITGGFWSERQDVVRTATLDHCLDWLNRQGSIANFGPADDGGKVHEHQGPIFTDSDVFKIMEALAWEVGRTADVAHEEQLTELTAAVAAAQGADGYVNTAFGRSGQPEKYSDLEWGHELYCAGHLIQAAVARARSGHADELLDVARKVADHVCEAFGPDGIQSVCGHPEIETALVELTRVTGDRTYLDQAALFVHRRGDQTLKDGGFGRAYFQDDQPVRRRTVFDGHAVRALYLAAGAVDVAVETDDQELLDAVVAQWTATVARRTYLTGGMGSRHRDEAFGDDFELPPDRAYAETCAAIALVMLSWRLLLATGEARFADVIERTLYNVVATSLGADGTNFFYANPLHVRRRGTVPSPDDLSTRASTQARAPWFDVPCCPTNLARLLASLSAYLVTADGRGLQVHQYADAEVDTTLDDGSPVGFVMTTGYPKHGSIALRITKAPSRLWTLSLRIPDWADGATLVRPGGGGRQSVKPGVIDVTRVFTAGDEIRLELPMTPRWVSADPRIDAVRGSVAVQRGPVVMCVESTDLPGDRDVDAVVVDTGAEPVERFGSVYVDGVLIDHADPAWPYGASSDEARQGRTSDLVKIPLVPYHSWANRGPSTMRVWLPTAAL